MFGLFLDFDFDIVVRNLILIGIAFLFAIPIGWDREREARSAGLRTFPLVATGSCGFLLMAQSLFGYDAGPMARVITGVITGIGFIGGGAIIKEGATVRGTATAASIWITGAIGAAVAFRRFEIAVVLCLLTFFALRILKPLKNQSAEMLGVEKEPGDKTE